MNVSDLQMGCIQMLITLNILLNRRDGGLSTLEKNKTVNVCEVTIKYDFRW